MCLKNALFQLIICVSVDKFTIYVDFDINFKWGTIKARKARKARKVKDIVFNVTPKYRNLVSPATAGRTVVLLCRPHG